MITPTSDPQLLATHLELRAAQSEDDIERLAAFHGSIHGPPLVDMSRALMRDHPQAGRPERWLYVADTAADQVVAGLSLIPWELRYGPVTLRAGEMAIVGTADAYRGRGLIRALNTRFDGLLRAGGYDISIIQGIPYFYRQFGYEYAMPLEAWCRVELHQFPADGARPEGYRFRRAAVADLPALTRLYDAACARLDISAVRGEDTWRFLLGRGLEIETAGEPWLVEAPDGATAGYLRVMATGFGDGLICGEASLLGAEAALAALGWLCDLARARGKPYLRLNLPATHPLNRLAIARGAAPWRAYAWQVRLLDPPALLMKLAPVFEARLAASPYAGLSRDLLIDAYRHAIRLRFAAGRLIAVESAPLGQPHDLRMPPQLLAPLLFGWRSLAELSYTYPDLYAAGDAQPLVETLFAPAEAFLYSMY